MKQVREGTFETNSSSTHSLVVMKQKQNNYIPLAKHIKVEWIDTNDQYMLETLTEKLSYLISHIANRLRWDCNNYNDLLEEIEDNFEYKKIEEYIKEKYDKDIRFPDNKLGIYDDMDCIVEINHQLIPDSSRSVIESVLDELIRYRKDTDGKGLYNEEKECDLSFEQKLDIYFESDNYLSFGRD